MSRNQSASAKRQARNLSCLQGMPLISIRGGCHVYCNCRKDQESGKEDEKLTVNSFPADYCSLTTIHLSRSKYHGSDGLELGVVSFE